MNVDISSNPRKVFNHANAIPQNNVEFFRMDVRNFAKFVATISKENSARFVATLSARNFAKFVATLSQKILQDLLQHFLEDILQNL